MSIDNMISLAFTPEEQKTIDDALTAIEGVIAGKFINLTPQERKKFASVGIATEDWVKKVKGYMAQNPQLVMNHINVEEYNRDYEVREALKPALNRIESLYHTFDDTSILLGRDLFRNAKAYYNGLKVAAKNNAPGAKTIYEDLQSRFPGHPKKGTSTANSQ